MLFRISFISAATVLNLGGEIQVILIFPQTMQLYVPSSKN